MYEGKTTFVAHITLVKGISFYGFNVDYKFFLKIYMLNPLHMTRLADLLRQGAIMKRTLQSYESHLQYVLQWMCDYNLYGCVYIDSKIVKFRCPISGFLQTNGTAEQWHDRSIPESSISDATGVQRQSHCSLEVDICVQDILNRLEILHRPLHHDFVERKTSFNPNQKLVHSMAGLWRDETRRRKVRMGLIDESSSLFPAEVLVSVSADSRNSQRGGWIHEDEYQRKIDDIMMDEKNKSDGRKVTFDSFVSKTPFEERVRTAFESVEDLFPQNLLISGFGRNSLTAQNENNEATSEETEVDENRVLSYVEDEVDYASDEEIARDMEMSQIKRRDHVEKLSADEVIVESEHRTNLEFVEHVALGQPDESNKKKLSASSAELAALGIRAIGDSSHSKEDAFEISKEYEEPLRLYGRQSGLIGQSSSASGSASKQRKMVCDERSTSRGRSEEHSTIDSEQSRSHLNFELHFRVRCRVSRARHAHLEHLHREQIIYLAGSNKSGTLVVIRRPPKALERP